MSFNAKVKNPLGINTILLLLRDKVSNFKMQTHLIQLNMKWTTDLNPGQTPVDVSDQPVYALINELLFRNPVSQDFPIFGQFHIEQSLFVIHGQLIKSSGLVQILTENKFSMTGLSAVVVMNNIKRVRFTLQITLRVLVIKLREAASVSEADLSSYDWLTQKSNDNPSFSYWKCVIDLPIVKLVFYI